MRRSVTVSPDGTSAYVASGRSDAVVVFDRAADGDADPEGRHRRLHLRRRQRRGMRRRDGAQRARLGDGVARRHVGLRRVVQRRRGGGVRPGGGRHADPEGRHRRLHLRDGQRRACADGTALDGALCGDGVARRHLGLRRVGLSSAVEVFDRARRRHADAEGRHRRLHLRGRHGGLCADGKALSGTDSVAVSPDGASVYVAVDAHRQRRGGGVRPRRGRHADPEGRHRRLHLATTGSGGQCVDGTGARRRQHGGGVARRHLGLRRGSRRQRRGGGVRPCRRTGR